MRAPLPLQKTAGMYLSTAAILSSSLKETETMILASGGSCTMLPGNVGDPDEVRAMFDKISALCGGLDVLVNNAGRAYFGLLSDMTDADWRSVIDTDLSSAFYCCRRCDPLHGFPKSRKDHQHLFHVGDFRRFLRSRLLRRKIRSARSDKGAGKGTGSQQYTG